MCICLIVGRWMIMDYLHVYTNKCVFVLVQYSIPWAITYHLTTACICLHSILTQFICMGRWGRHVRNWRTTCSVSMKSMEHGVVAWRPGCRSCLRCWGGAASSVWSFRVPVKLWSPSTRVSSRRLSSSYTMDISMLHIATVPVLKKKGCVFCTRSVHKERVVLWSSIFYVICSCFVYTLSWRFTDRFLMYGNCIVFVNIYIYIIGTV